MSDKNILVFLDNIGRSVIGVLAEESTTHVKVENPAIVHVVPNAQTNQLQLQILPLFFKEFTIDRNKSIFWSFNKSNITLNEGLELTPQFINQYKQLVGVPAEQPNSDPEVIKLFDE